MWLKKIRPEKKSKTVKRVPFEKIENQKLQWIIEQEEEEKKKPQQ